MKKLDWYIFKNFLTTFFFAIFLFTLVAIVIDISEKADDFVKSHLSLKLIITQYYVGFVPHIVALLFPLFVFIAVIFFTSKMAGRTEIVAILASGTSFNRWLRPYFAGGILLAVLLWLANHYLVPNANKIRGAFEAKYFDPNSSYENLLKSRFGNGSDFYIKTDSFTYAGVTNYDTTSKSGGPVFMNTIQHNKVVENIRAEKMMWDTANKKWQLQTVIIRKLNAMGENVKEMAQLYYNFNFTPSEIKKDKYTKDKLSSPELASFIQSEELRGSEGLSELKVELGRRNATPVTVFLLTIIGAVIAGRKVRGGSGVHLAAGFIIAALFILADKFSTIFSTKGNLPPAIAVWMPNFLFLFVVIYLHRKAPK